MLSFDSVMNQN